MKKIILVISLTLISLCMTAQLRLDSNIHHILFLGNSITYAGNYITDIETFIVTHHPGLHVEFINAGLPSETVSGLSEEGHADGKFPRPDLHERLKRLLDLTKPDLVFACYGMNDGIYLPFEASRFQKFTAGMQWLHDEVTKTGTKIVHLTPPVYDELKGPCKGYANTLDRYADWLISQAKAAGWEVADLHYPMKKILEQRRKKEPTFAFADDGVHPGEAGHWIMAQAVLAWLGEPLAANATGIQKAIATTKNGKEIFSLIAQRQALMKDAWLTAAGHKRPGMPAGLPLPEALEKAAATEKQVQSLMH